MQVSADNSFSRIVKMTSCDYQILEYSNSELRTHGVPFIVILRFHMQNEYKLTGYVLQNWEAKIGIASEAERGDIEVFLVDLRHYSQTSPSSDLGFFHRLSALSIGPLRAFASGSCLTQDLDSILPVFFAGQIETSTWRCAFNLVGEDLLGLAGELGPLHSTSSLPSGG
jgi:hypothetical protein